jgi:hypothetical protein
LRYDVSNCGFNEGGGNDRRYAVGAIFNFLYRLPIFTQGLSDGQTDTSSR